LAIREDKERNEGRKEEEQRNRGTEGNRVRK
jgi:hypothetical protein